MSLAELVAAHDSLCRRLHACQATIRADRAKPTPSRDLAHTIERRQRLRVELGECHRQIQTLCSAD